MFRKICFFITVSIGLSTWQTGKSEQYKAGVLDRPFESKPAQTPSDASPSEALLAATVRIETCAAADRSCGSGTIVGYHRGKAIVATCAPHLQ